ncbi:MAG: hypothetical protein U0638_09940 [Phycisphaerales bacterium]
MQIRDESMTPEERARIRRDIDDLRRAASDFPLVKLMLGAGGVLMAVGAFPIAWKLGTTGWMTVAAMMLIVGVTFTVIFAIPTFGDVFDDRKAYTAEISRLEGVLSLGMARVIEVEGLGAWAIPSTDDDVSGMLIRDVSGNFVLVPDVTDLVEKGGAGDTIPARLSLRMIRDSREPLSVSAIDHDRLAIGDELPEPWEYDIDNPVCWDSIDVMKAADLFEPWRRVIEKQ